MNIGERSEAAFNGLLQTLRRVGARKTDGCLHVSKHILTTVLRLTSQSRNQFPSPPFLGDIPCYLRGANNFAFDIPHRRHGERNDDRATMLALTDSFEMVDTLSSPDPRQNFAFVALS